MDWSSSKSAHKNATPVLPCARQSKSARQWGIDLVGKILRATHQLWMERNHILHFQTAGGIRGLEMVCIQTAVNKQFDLAYAELQDEDFIV